MKLKFFERIFGAKGLDVNDCPPPHQVRQAENSGAAATAHPNKAETWLWLENIKKQKSFPGKLRVAVFDPHFLSNRLFAAVAIISSLFLIITAWIVLKDAKAAKDYFTESYYDQR